MLHPVIQTAILVACFFVTFGLGVRLGARFAGWEAEKMAAKLLEDEIGRRNRQRGRTGE